MFGGLVNALLRPIQSISQHLQQQQTRSPQRAQHSLNNNAAAAASASTLTNSSSPASLSRTNSYASGDATPIKSAHSSASSDRTNSGFGALATTNSSSSHSSSSTAGDPFVTPIHSHHHQQHPSSPPLYVIPTPALTPVPKLQLTRAGSLLRNQQMQDPHLQQQPPLVRRFSINNAADDDDDQDDDESAMQSESKESQHSQQHQPMRKRAPSMSSAAVEPNGDSITSQLEAETGHLVKKPRLAHSTDASPRRTRRNSKGQPVASSSTGAVPTASLFKFGALPATTKPMPLFSHKPSNTVASRKQQAVSQNVATGPSNSATAPPLFPPSAASIPSSVFQPLAAAASSTSSLPLNPSVASSSSSSFLPPSHSREESSSSAAMEDIPADMNVVMTNVQPIQPQPQPPQRQPSATQSLAGKNVPSPSQLNSLDNMTISPPITLPSFEFNTMSLGGSTASNPFQRTQSTSSTSSSTAAAPSTAAPVSSASMDAATIERLRSFKSSRDARRPDMIESLRAERKQAQAEAIEAEILQRSDSLGKQRVDIKTSTKNGIPNRSTRARTPVPTWQNQPATNNAVPQPQQPAGFTSLQPDAAFHAQPTAAPSNPHVPFAAPASFSSLPRPPREQLTDNNSLRAVHGREEMRRKEREAMHRKQTRETRERTMKERRKEKEEQEQERQRQMQQQEVEIAAATAAAAAASTFTVPNLRRSARHSASPSPSPPIPTQQQQQPSHGTPSPRNRFTTPLANTPAAPSTAAAAAAAASSSSSAPSPTPQQAPRTRASMRAASPVILTNEPSPRATRASTAAANAEALAQSIAARKVREAEQTAARLQERQSVLDATNRAAERRANERDELKGAAARKVALRARGKGYDALLREFAPTIRAEYPSSQLSYDVLRKAMRKAMARFHPDKHTNSPTKNQLEAEETFVVLKKAYDELVTLCR